MWSWKLHLRRTHVIEDDEETTRFERFSHLIDEALELKYMVEGGMCVDDVIGLPRQLHSVQVGRPVAQSVKPLNRRRLPGSSDRRP